MSDPAAEENLRNVGAALRYKRVSRNWSQQTAGAKLGCSGRIITEMEHGPYYDANGKAKSPHFSTNLFQDCVGMMGFVSIEEANKEGAAIRALQTAYKGREKEVGRAITILRKVRDEIPMREFISDYAPQLSLGRLNDIETGEGTTSFELVLLAAEAVEPGVIKSGSFDNLLKTAESYQQALDSTELEDIPPRSRRYRTDKGTGSPER